MKKHLGTLIGILIILGLAVWGVFYFVNNRNSKLDIFQKKTSSTEAESLISKDLERFYPSSVREVVRLYMRINKACYTEKITEDDFDALLKQMRLLFDDELLAVNEYNDHRLAFYDEVTTFKNEKKQMTLYKVQKQSEVEKWKGKDGKDYASIIGCYMNSTQSGFEYTYEKFLLRLEDETGKWKIVGWELTKPVDIGE